MYNRVILMGRLTKDPDLRYTPSGKAVASFRLAVDRTVGEKATDFIDIVVWDKQAEVVSEHLVKGRVCLVEGRLQMRQYEHQDGTKRTVYEVVAEKVRFVGGKPAGQSAPEPASEDDDVPF